METANPIIADTSALISLLLPSDANNQQALALSATMRQRNRRILLPGDVFSETVNTLGKKFGHAEAAAVGDTLLNPEEFQLIESTPELRRVALEKFKKQPNAVSFTDCVVMAVADSYATREIFGFDEAFGKNGYRLPHAA